MILLSASCLALILGPLILKLTGARPKVIATMDGFVLMAVIGLVFFHLLPSVGRYPTALHLVHRRVIQLNTT